MLKRRLFSCSRHESALVLSGAAILFSPRRDRLLLCKSIAGYTLADKFPWNAQKNQMSDIKGKEREQEREGQIKNDMINRNRPPLN